MSRNPWGPALQLFPPPIPGPIAVIAATGTTIGAIIIVVTPLSLLFILKVPNSDPVLASAIRDSTARPLYLCGIGLLWLIGAVLVLASLGCRKPVRWARVALITVLVTILALVLAGGIPSAIHADHLLQSGQVHLDPGQMRFFSSSIIWTAGIVWDIVILVAVIWAIAILSRPKVKAAFDAGSWTS